MTTEELKFRLIHGLTAYDQRQSTKRGYNRYALGIYLGRVDDICADVERGADIASAIRRGFSGAVLRAACKAAGVPIQADDNSSMVYRPVTGE